LKSSSISTRNCSNVWLSDVVSDYKRANRRPRPTIAKFGGSLGLRDRGALESALARPQSGYYEDIIQEAAALWESLSQNHPFVDGNKRVAVTVTAAFLKIDGYSLEFDDLEAYKLPDWPLRNV